MQREALRVRARKTKHVRLTATPPEAGEASEPRASWLGFRLPLEMLIAPARAFADVTPHPKWLAAYALIVASGLAGLAMSTPAVTHLVAVTKPPDGFLGKPAAEIAEYTKAALENMALEQFLLPLYWIGLTATVLTTIARFKGKDTSFRVYVALAANCLVPTVFGNLLGGVAVAAHPAASYHDLRSIEIALPDNLALLADPTNAREIFFLAAFDVFALWSTILLAFGFAATTPVKFETALGVSFALLLVLAVFPAW